MELKLQREILRLRPELTAKAAEDIASDVFYYWVEGCLEDLLDEEYPNES